MPWLSKYLFGKYDRKLRTKRLIHLVIIIKLIIIYISIFYSETRIKTNKNLHSFYWSLGTVSLETVDQLAVQTPDVAKVSYVTEKIVGNYLHFTCVYFEKAIIITKHRHLKIFVMS